MKKNKFIIVTHASVSNDVDIAGPAHTIFSYLVQKKEDILFLRHSIYEDGKTFTTNFWDNNEKNSIVKKNRLFGEFSDRLHEGIITLSSSFNYSQSTKKIIYIAADPLNTLWGILLKKIGKVDALVTFNTDYMPRRYSNSFYQAIYSFLDKISLQQSDYVLAVSQRIIAARKKQGISEKKLFWLPNAPAISQVKNFTTPRKDAYKLITVSTSPFIEEFKLLIDAVAVLQKDFPKIKLTIIGSSKMEKKINQEIVKKKLKNTITFMSAMSYDNVLKQVAMHGVGIAFYSEQTPHKYYLDSMKARDYLAFGLPVIISGDNGTSEDIEKEKAGIHIETTKESLVGALRTLFISKGKYMMYSKNAFKLAKMRDKEKLLDTFFKRLDL